MCICIHSHEPHLEIVRCARCAACYHCICCFSPSACSLLPAPLCCPACRHSCGIMTHREAVSCDVGCHWRSWDGGCVMPSCHCSACRPIGGGMRGGIGCYESHLEIVCCRWCAAGYHCIRCFGPSTCALLPAILHCPTRWHCRRVAHCEAGGSDIGCCSCGWGCGGVLQRGDCSACRPISGYVRGRVSCHESHLIVMCRTRCAAGYCRICGGCPRTRSFLPAILHCPTRWHCRRVTHCETGGSDIGCYWGGRGGGGVLQRRYRSACRPISGYVRGCVSCHESHLIVVERAGCAAGYCRIGGGRPRTRSFLPTPFCSPACRYCCGRVAHCEAAGGDIGCYWGGWGGGGDLNRIHPHCGARTNVRVRVRGRRSMAVASRGHAGQGARRVGAGGAKHPVTSCSTWAYGYPCSICVFEVCVYFG